MSFITPNVPITASGSATLVITVAQSLRRKRKITMTTSPTVKRSVNCTSATEARIVAVRSVKMAMRTEGGIDARSFGNSAFTRSAVSITLAPG